VTSAASPTRRPRRQRRAVLAILVVVVTLAVAAWWTWPALTTDDRPGVLVLADGLLAGGERAVELRAREDGRTVRWAPFEATWCAHPEQLADLVAGLDPARVVVSPATVEPACLAELAAVLRGREPVLVAQAAAGDPAVPAVAGLALVDPTRLVGRPGDDPRRPCVWWESCDGDGRIAVREPSGQLTAAGQERVARMLVAAL
jgi:hypothetical protein